MGCSSSASSAVTDAAAETAIDAGDGCSIPAEANVFAGRLPYGAPAGEPLWQPKSVYRIDSALDPLHPRILFLSTVLECAALADKGWEGRIPPTRMLYLELGRDVVGTYPASSVEPPAMDASYLFLNRSYTPPEPPTEVQYAKSGSVTVTDYPRLSTSGTFVAEFVTAPPESVRVCGRFVAASCHVNW